MGQKLKPSVPHELSDMPKTWQVAPIKTHVRSMGRGQSPTYADETGCFVANQACLSTYSFRASKQKECEKMVGTKGRYVKGDVLIASTGGGILGKVAMSESDGYCDSHVSVLKMKNPETSRFIFRWMSIHYDLINDLFAKGSTNQTEFQKGIFLDYKIAFPPSDEQKAIADFLDRETALIDKRLALIEKKRALLSELKKSVIHEAVTKGLDKSVAMKDSGVEWIGEIPLSWEKSRVKTLFKIEGGSTPSASEIDIDFNIPWATPTDFGDIERVLAETSRAISISGLKEIGGYQAKEGEIVLSCRAPAGKVSMVGKQPIAFNQGCKALRKRHSSMNEVFYFYALVAARNEIEEMSRGTTFLEIASGALGRIKMPKPSLKEQDEISNYLDKKMQVISSAMTKMNRYVALLKEQRQALIHEVVTGKRRVI